MIASPRVGRIVLHLCAVILIAAPCCAAQQNSTDSSEPDSPASVFPHSQTSRFWISGQFNTILQGHPGFDAKYSGTNSLRDHRELEDSRVMTLYTGVQLSNTTEAFFDLESAGGHGISDALGLAGFTNLDVVRSPDLGTVPYVARLMFRQVIPLSAETAEAQRTPLSLLTRLPVRRLEVRFGKFSIPDFFDINEVGSDSHLQFMNWTIDNNGAYDYSADTRGYTVGGMLEYDDRNWALRFAETMMPVVANGPHLQWSLRKARAENIEFELHPSIFKQRASAVRVLSFINHADMGDYDTAIALFRAGITPTPDIIATRQPGTVKYGFGLNLEQELTADARAFARTGWNEGQHESFAYTEVDETVQVGGDVRGRPWRRRMDRAGVAFVSNGISRPHQQYLALGGLGFLLGDGALTYGRETILETYYTAHIWRGIFTAADLQYIANPGYNRDRGPVIVPTVRLHVDF